MLQTAQAESSVSAFGSLVVFGVRWIRRMWKRCPDLAISRRYLTTESGGQLHWILLPICFLQLFAAEAKSPQMPEKYGAPDRIRTCDLWNRNPTLYPAELRVHAEGGLNRLSDGWFLA